MLPPAGSPGSGIFDRVPLGSGIFPARVAKRVFLFEVAVSESSLAFQRSSSQRRTTKPGEGRRSPGSGIPPPGSPRERDFRGSGFQYLGAGFALRKFPLARERDSPLNKTGSGIFDRVPAGVTGERNFPLPGSRSGFFFPAVSESSDP